MRIYQPSTIALLGEQHQAGAVVVTEAFVVAEDDSEDAEYAALMTAAAESAALLLGAPGRRVVVVAEVGTEPAPGEAVALREVVAVHADTAERPADADPDEDLAWFATQEIGYLV